MMNTKGTSLIGTGLLIIMFIVAVFLIASIDTVDANHIGVKNKFGVIKGVQTPGMQWTGAFTHVYQYNLMTRPFEITLEGKQAAATKEGQAVYAVIRGNWKIKSDAVTAIYENVGKDDGTTIYDVLNIEGRMKHGFKSVTTQYVDGLDIINNRDEVMELAVASMREQFPNEYAELEFIVVENIYFDDAYQAAIDNKKAQEQAALAAIAEAEKKTQIAIGDKAVRIENADALLYEQEKQADAKAYTTLEIARAEAKALELKAQELTPLMVQQNMIDAWSGNYPTNYFVGNSDMDMLMQLPN